MIFKRFLKARSKANRIPEDQDALIQLVHGGEDTAMRREACRRIDRLPELRELAVSDVDAGVREIASAHYRKLLCGLDGTSPPVSVRLEELAAIDDQNLIKHVAHHASEAEVRQAAILRLDNPTAVAECALSDPLSANRCAAVELLSDKAALESVLKGIGKRDKNVYRIARTKIRDIAEREALPVRVRAQCEELCEKLERLGRFESWVQDRGMLDLLDRQWVEIEPDADDEWRSRYSGLRERFLAGYDAYRREHEAQVAAEEAREDIRNERGVLLDALASCSHLTEESELRDRLAQIGERWDELQALPQKEQEALEQRFSDLRAKAAAQLDELAARHRRNTRLSRLVQRAETALAQTAPMETKHIRSLLDDAEALLTATGADQELVHQFAALREKLEGRLSKQKRHADQRLAELPEKLDELSAALDAGELKHAEPLFQSAQAGLELSRASGLSRRACDLAAERLKKLAPRLRELQKWRKWGSDQHREELCGMMEELGQLDITPEAMTLRLHDLQMEWKSLDRGGSPVNHPLWDRFHTLSEQVYERCKPYLEAQAAERDANRVQREDLCSRLEDFLEKVDWERMDWKKAGRAAKEMRGAWASCGPVEGRHRKVLEKRFRNAIKRLDAHLSEERSRNQEHKRELIARAETLIQEPDLDLAIEGIKRLQHQWHTTVPARQKEENKLWQRFRAACDAVFARRRELQEAQVAELEENLRQRQIICDEAERLAASDAEPEEIEQALRDLESRWRSAERSPVPRQSAAKVAQRWREARGLVQGHQRERRDVRRRAAVDLLARQAALCESLERALETNTGSDAVTATAEAEWQNLPRQRDSALQAAIERRFRAATEQLGQGEASPEDLAERLAANGLCRAEICLHLEILAGVDSPPDLTKERLAFQVSRLKEHMREGEKDPLEGAGRLLEEWYLCGPAPASQAPVLEQRFQRARAALEGRDDNSAPA